MHSEKFKTQKQRERRELRRKKALRWKQPFTISVFRSAKHIYAQIIDNVNQRAVAGVGTLDKELKDIKDKKEAAKQVGMKLAALAKEKGIERALFNRGSYRYHGRVAAVADGARAGGLTV